MRHTMTRYTHTLCDLVHSVTIACGGRHFFTAFSGGGERARAAPDITVEMVLWIARARSSSSDGQPQVWHAQYTTKQVCCEEPEKKTRLWRNGARLYLKSQMFGKRVDPFITWGR